MKSLSKLCLILAVFTFLFGFLVNLIVEFELSEFKTEPAQFVNLAFMFAIFSFILEILSGQSIQVGKRVFTKDKNTFVYYPILVFLIVVFAFFTFLLTKSFLK